MDMKNVKPIGTRCLGCQGQANVLIEGWTLDGPLEVQAWTCPRCRAANTILTQGKVVGVATAAGYMVSGASRTPRERV
jgi:hypothetical protein